MLPWIHPTLVHFAIGLLLAGVVFDVVGLARTNEKLIFAGYWNTVLGTVAALCAVLSGLYAEKHLGPHSSIGNALLEVHRLFGFLVLGLATVLSAWRISMKGYILPRRRTLYLTGAFFSGFVIFVTGGFGGALVYLYGLGLPPEAAQHVIDAQAKVSEKRSAPDLAAPGTVPEAVKTPAPAAPKGSPADAGHK